MVIGGFASRPSPRVKVVGAPPPYPPGRVSVTGAASGPACAVGLGAALGEGVGEAEASGMGSASPGAGEGDGAGAPGWVSPGGGPNKSNGPGVGLAAGAPGSGVGAPPGAGVGSAPGSGVTSLEPLSMFPPPPWPAGAPASPEAGAPPASAPPPPGSWAIMRTASSAVAHMARTCRRRFIFGGGEAYSRLLDHRAPQPFGFPRNFSRLSAARTCHRSALRMALEDVRRRGFAVKEGFGKKGTAELADAFPPRKRLVRRLTRKPAGAGGSVEGSGQRESNPHGQLGRLELYH